MKGASKTVTMKRNTMLTSRLGSKRPNSSAVNATTSDVESWGIEAAPMNKRFFLARARIYL